MPEDALLREVSRTPTSGEKVLRGQKALVTGASAGIGRAIAISLGQAGADVVVDFSSKADEAEEVVEEIRSFGVRAYAYKADVRKEDQVRAMFANMFEEFGTIDILVSNAGVQRDAPLEQMTLADWQFVLDVNLTGQFLCAREAVVEFKRRGVVPEISTSAGKIISISSVHELIPWAGHVNYAAAKGGAMMLTRSIAQEVAPHRIRVNSIAPGAIRTQINAAAWATQEAEQELLKLIPYRRMGEPVEIGQAAVWLASDASDYVHGISLFVDGGMTLYPGFDSGG